MIISQPCGHYWCHKNEENFVRKNNTDRFNRSSQFGQMKCYVEKRPHLCVDQARRWSHRYKIKRTLDMQWLWWCPMSRVDIECPLKSGKQQFYEAFCKRNLFLNENKSITCCTYAQIALTCFRFFKPSPANTELSQTQLFNLLFFVIMWIYK